jgi:hypothetical protein
MRRLADYLKKRNWKTQQVQAFIPLPGTPAAAYYWAGTDSDGKKLHVAKDMKEKRKQFETLLWHTTATKSFHQYILDDRLTGNKKRIK